MCRRQGAGNPSPDAKLVSRQPDPYPPGSFGTLRYKETVLESYDPYQGQLIVTTDMQTVSLPVPPRSEKPRP